MDPRKLWALIFGWTLLAAEAVLLVLGYGPLNSEGVSLPVYLMIVAGGPLTLLLGLLIGLLDARKWGRQAGAILWLGASALALGIAMRSGPHLGRYFLGLSALVVPQAAVGTMLLLHAKDATGRKLSR